MPSPLPPVAILSLNRPDYLREVLESLAAQRDAGMERREVFLFQDHWHNPHTGRRCAEPEEVEACLRVFRESFPRGHVLTAPANLGEALNYRRAEEHVFRGMGADCAYFFEDDLVLHPRYLATLDALRAACAESTEVGYFACYGHLRAPLAAQRKRQRVLQRLGAFWGFGLFRHHWEAMQPLMADYHELTCGCDYRARPHAEILRRYFARGIAVASSAQDDVKRAVTFALGRVAVNTVAANARYIGARGERMTPERFEQQGYGRTQWLDLDRLDLAVPDAAVCEAIRQEEAAIAARRAGGQPPGADGTAHSLVPPAPRMTAEERGLFESVLASGRRRYAEFGTGGSTLLAIRQPFEALVGIESDSGWAEAVRQHPEVAPSVANGRASILHADIGPVAGWGAPVDRQPSRAWMSYIASMWNEWHRRGSHPDLVMVDGRFRVACCLSVAMLHRMRGRAEEEAPLVMLHDVSPRRPNYDLVFDFFALEARVGSLCVMSPRADTAPEALMAAMLGRLLELG
ncbi:hypothetical protein [Falsiroseomonas sp. HW251]|uniref:hypothetical protein n=1 Tax=Falsiroseomonas sp. HW251 TaxID=3390998 RepID=UPI003D3182BA